MGEPRTYDVAEFFASELGRYEGEAIFGVEIESISHRSGTSDFAILFTDGGAFEVSVRRSIDGADGTERDETIDAREKEEKLADLHRKARERTARYFAEKRDGTEVEIDPEIVEDFVENGGTISRRTA